MKDEKIVAWVSKYALTQGIFKVDGVVDHEISGGKMFSYSRSGRLISGCIHDGWHRSFNEALLHAEELRRNRLKSLRKSIAKLEVMGFAFTDLTEK